MLCVLRQIIEQSHVRPRLLTLPRLGLCGTSTQQCYRHWDALCRLQALIRTIPGMRAVSGPSGAPLASIADMVIASVNGTDVDIRKELFAGVVLTGTPSRTQVCYSESLVVSYTIRCGVTALTCQTGCLRSRCQSALVFCRRQQPIPVDQGAAGPRAAGGGTASGQGESVDASERDRAQVLRMAGRVHPGVSRLVPPDVDEQERV